MISTSVNDQRKDNRDNSPIRVSSKKSGTFSFRYLGDIGEIAKVVAGTVIQRKARR